MKNQPNAKNCCKEYRLKGYVLKIYIKPLLIKKVKHRLVNKINMKTPNLTKPKLNTSPKRGRKILQMTQGGGGGSTKMSRVIFSSIFELNFTAKVFKKLCFK